jgi:hypothetical protein
MRFGVGRSFAATIRTIGGGAGLVPRGVRAGRATVDAFFALAFLTGFALAFAGFFFGAAFAPFATAVFFFFFFGSAAAFFGALFFAAAFAAFFGAAFFAFEAFAPFDAFVFDAEAVPFFVLPVAMDYSLIPPSATVKSRCHCVPQTPNGSPIEMHD